MKLDCLSQLLEIVVSNNGERVRESSTPTGTEALAKGHTQRKCLCSSPSELVVLELSLRSSYQREVAVKRGGWGAHFNHERVVSGTGCL